MADPKPSDMDCCDLCARPFEADGYSVPGSDGRRYQRIGFLQWNASQNNQPHEWRICGACEGLFILFVRNRQKHLAVADDPPASGT
jgi:hypothetical protein